MKKTELREIIEKMVMEVSNTKPNFKIKLMVRNTITDEVFPVGAFGTHGDAYMALTAFKKAAPNHLEYFLKKM